MTGDISSFKINTPYILLTPGCAPQHSQKRWPAQSYAALAQEILKQGITPVIIGTKAEEKEAQTIQEIAPKTINLVEQTSLAQIVSLSKNAVAAVGNDTGPMHLIGASGCPSLVLFSKNSNPIRHKPKGKCVEALQRDNLADLDVKTVLESMNAIMQQ